MESYTHEGSVPEDDPRYKEVFAIKGPDKCLEDIGSAEDQKLIDYLPESTREHGLIGKWLCLLYTSPSPRDQRGSRMPSSA